MYQSFSATSAGISHTKHGKGCEDFSLHSDMRTTLLKTWFVSYAAAADGHGSDDNFRSAQGARIAAKCASLGIIDFVKQRKTALLPREEFEKLLRAFIKHIVARWQIEVEEDYKSRPFTEDELAKASEKYRAEYQTGKRRYRAYGTTLLLTAVTADYWFGIHIGDGRFTALGADGVFAQPVPWDERCFLNATTSICDDDAAERARYYFCFTRETPPPAAVFLCSDGVDDNYPVEDNEQHLYKLYRTVAETFASDGFESTCKQIAELAANFAAKGKGDDTSIAGVIDMNAVRRVVETWKAADAAAAKTASAVQQEKIKETTL